MMMMIKRNTLKNLKETCCHSDDCEKPPLKAVVKN